jgi:hypothetical protein
MQRRPDQFIGDTGAVVLGGVDVIDAETNARHGDRLENITLWLHALMVMRPPVRRHHRNPVTIRLPARRRPGSPTRVRDQR